MHVPRILKERKVKVQMFDYTDNMLKELPDGWLDVPACTPSENHLFHVDENVNKLTEAEELMYHHNTAKLLFLSKQAIPYVQTSVALYIPG